MPQNGFQLLLSNNKHVLFLQPDNRAPHGILVFLVIALIHFLSRDSN